jgi:hypothetical protein
MSSSTKPTIVIVDGAWTDASSFTGVQKILSADGFDVLEFGEHSSDRPLFSAPVAAGASKGCPGVFFCRAGQGLFSQRLPEGHKVTSTARPPSNGLRSTTFQR